MRATYLDSSAVVKLVTMEPETAALRQYLRRRRPLVSSALARTEVLRTLLSFGEVALARGRRVLRTIELLRVSDRVFEAAGTLLPAEVRSLDAIHLSTAQQLGDDLGVVVTYDVRMADAATLLGLKTHSPV
jgi:predicted nucleic acid-binding protein